MDQVVTVLDVLRDVLNTLNGISVPMTQINEIGLPLVRSINNIKMCVEAMEKDEAERAAAAEAANAQEEPAGEEDA